MVAPQTEIIINLDGVQLVRRVLEPGDYVIGSHPAADIVASAEGVAPQHAQLTVGLRETRIQDLGSESGTFVAGKLANKSVRVWPNQKVLLGPAVLETRRLRAEASEAFLPPPVAAVRRMLPDEFRREKKYEIGGTIGEGGMGAVLSAREATTHRTVAMKVMLPSMSQDDVSRFIAEAQITSQLEHPNIVPVHELGVDEHDQVFYTMKLVQGVTLRELLDKLRAGDPETCADYPLRRLLVVLMRVCDAMAFAHSRGVIHRDLKPGNVMIGDFGEVLVMDWGLARALGVRAVEYHQPSVAHAERQEEEVHSVRNNEVDTVTMVGSLIGTPHYMSPEQANGETETLDERTDVWALGGILRHILALARPVAGHTTDEIVENVRAGRLTPIPALAAHCPGGRVPDALTAVATKAQSVMREQRYASAAEFRSEIDAYLGGYATNAEQAGTARQIWLLVMRHRAMTVSLLVLLVLSVVFVFQLMESEHRAEQSAQTARTHEVAAQKNEQSARVAEAVAVREKETTRWALARAQVSIADAAYRESNSTAMLAALEGVPEDLRDSEWRYLRAHADNSQAKIPTPNGLTFIGAAAHPTRPGVFAMASTEGAIVLADAKTGRWLSSFPITERQKKGYWCRGLDFSPDGTRLVVGSLGKGSVAVYRVEDGKPLSEWEAQGTDVVQFNSRGTEALSVDAHAELTIHDAETGALKWKYEPCLRAAFVSDGRVVAASGTSLRILDGGSGTVLTELPSGRANVSWVTCSPDGQTAYVASRDGSIRGVNLADGRTVFEASLDQRGGWPRVVVTGGGRYVIAASGVSDRYRAIRMWDAKTGVLLPPLLGAASFVEGMAVHPLSDDLVVTGPDTRTWNLATRLAKRTLTGGEEASVFWGEDDLFLPDGVPVRLSGGEGGAVPPEVWPTDYRHAGIASTGGDVAAVAKWNEEANSSKVAVFRKSGSKIALTGEFEYGYPSYLLRVSPTGESVAVVNFYDALRVWDTATGTRQPKCDVTGIRNIHDLGWVDRQRLLGLVSTQPRGAAGWEERVVLWDTSTGRQLRSVAHASAIDCLAVAPDGRTFAEAGIDQRVRIRDAETLAVIHEFRAHDGPITALAFHPTKPILATGAADLSIRLWNLGDESLIEEIRAPGQEPHWLQFSPSGNLLTSADEGRHVFIWDLRGPASAYRAPARQTPEEEAAEQRKIGYVAGRASRWSEARAGYSQAIQQGSTEGQDWSHLSPVLLQLGDREAYRQHCHDMLERFGGTDDPLKMERTAKACLLLPLEDADRGRAIRLGEAAATIGKDSSYFPWFKFAKGFGQYRAGQFGPAVETLQTFKDGAVVSTLEVHAVTVLAMALHHLGKTEEARAVFARARDAMNSVLPLPGDADQTDGWHDVLTARLLLNEAQEELETK